MTQSLVELATEIEALAKEQGCGAQDMLDRALRIARMWLASGSAAQREWLSTYLEICTQHGESGISNLYANSGNNILDESDSQGDDESSNRNPFDWWDHVIGDAFNDAGGIVAVVVPSSPVTAYFDESYNHPKAGSNETAIYTVACYYGLREHWDDFRKEWNAALTEKGLDQCGFHMNKFEFARAETIAGRNSKFSEDNPYRDWTRDDFDNFLNRLHGIIGTRAPSGLPRIAPLATHLIKADFDETRPDELKNDPQCRSYYITCVANLMDALAAWARNNKYLDPIHYVFAGLKDETSNLGNWFDYCWKHPDIAFHYRLGKGYSRVPHDIQQASAEPALQAADILAYDLMKGNVKWIGNNYADMHLSQMRKSLDSLVRQDHWGWTLRKQDLEELFAEIPPLRMRYPV